MPAVDGFLVNSRFYGEQMGAMLQIPADKLHVVPLGLDTDDFRTDAVRKLVEGVRTRAPEVARVCAVCLRELTGEDLPLDDRDAWLRWWQDSAIS